jgi:hypothetical protein
MSKELDHKVKTALNETTPSTKAWRSAHGTASPHQRLGSIMRARETAYQMSAEFRGQRNGCPTHEPARFP